MFFCWFKIRSNRQHCRLTICRFLDFVKSEANPNNNLMMRRAGLFKIRLATTFLFLFEVVLLLPLLHHCHVAPRDCRGWRGACFGPQRSYFMKGFVSYQVSIQKRINFHGNLRHQWWDCWLHRFILVSNAICH